MMGLLKRIYETFDTPLGIRMSERWKEEKHGTRWRFVKENDRGIKLYKELSRRYKNMETGESALLVRKDRDTEWYEHDEKWPAYAKRAYEDGHVWEDELLDEGEMPTMWGSLMATSGKDVWRRIE